MTELKTKEEWKELLDSVDTVLFDCDGVLWTGSNIAIPQAQDVIKFLKSEGKSLYFVTNNSGKSRAEYHKKFQRLNFDVSEEEIFCSGYASAYYLKHMLKFEGKVYLVGMDGFGDELTLLGIPFFGPGVDPIEGDPPDWAKSTLDPEVNAVIVGYDKHFSMAKLVKACSYAKNPQNHFIGTNMDTYLPIENKEILIPGTGCFIQAVTHGAERKPLVIGKPNLPMFEVIKERTNLDPSRTLMVGDRLSTDIQFGLRFGMKTLLVYTGAVSRDVKMEEAERPHYIADSVAGFLTCSQ